MSKSPRFAAFAECPSLACRIGVDLIPLDTDEILVGKAQTSPDVREESGDIFAVVSTPTIDSYGDIIRQGRNEKGDGWLLDRFNTAPVQLWSHNMWGFNLSGPETRAFIAKDIETPKGKFAEALVLHPAKFDTGDPEAMVLEGKIRRNVIKENSVGFVSKIDSFRRNGETDEIVGVEFFEQELLELSWANRGANPDTSAMFKSMMMNHPELAKKVATFETRDIADARDDADDSVAQYADRVKTLEALVVGLQDSIAEQEARVKDLTARARERRDAAKTEAAAQLDGLINRLRSVR